MNIVVLLSQGMHPVSGRPAPVPVELQAIGLALHLLQENPAGQATPVSLSGLHAGPGHDALADHGGHGLTDILHLRLPAGADPLPALYQALRAAQPDLILAGRRGQGGEDSGLLPYRLAAALALPLCADAVSLAAAEPGLLAVQALPRGARRAVSLGLPALVTVHPAARPPRGFAFARARETRLRLQKAAAPPDALPLREERPSRPRPKIMARASGPSGGTLLVDPPAEEAAAAILRALAGYGVLGGKGLLF